MSAALRRTARSHHCNSAPISVGVGFLALDWLLIGRDRTKANQQSAGGSCGNVLSILAFLDWSSYPVARLANDRQAQELIGDLKQSRVRTEFVTTEPMGVTPVMVVRLAETADGRYRSRFEWKHPKTGDWLPRYRPLPKGHAARIAPQLPNANVFYFDRAEPAALLIATAMREKGAAVFFEPSSCRDEALFTKCLAVSDIVKYSADRIPTPPRNPLSHSPRLEIQTLGAEGLRYRLKMDTNLPGPWRSLGAFPVDDLKDATGCGDWCSAGIIHELCRQSREKFLVRDETEIATGIRFGQALAAINCRYEGARGPMYKLSREDLATEAQRLLAIDQRGNRSARHSRAG